MLLLGVQEWRDAVARQKWSCQVPRYMKKGDVALVYCSVPSHCAVLRCDHCLSSLFSFRFVRECGLAANVNITVENVAQQSLELHSDDSSSPSTSSSDVFVYGLYFNSNLTSSSSSLSSALSEIQIYLHC